MHINDNRTIKFIGTEEDKAKWKHLSLIESDKIYKVNHWWEDSGFFVLYEFPEQEHEGLLIRKELTLFPIDMTLWEFVN